MMVHFVRSVALVLSFNACLSLATAETIDVWIGTGSKPSQGIYHCTLDTQTGKLSEAKLVAEMSGPGFLALHPRLSILYAIGSLDGQPVVAAYQITGNLQQAGLKLLNSQPIGDGGATHLSIAKNGRTIVTAQYGNGSVAAFSVSEDGKIAGRSQLIKHPGGSKVVAGRQDSAHAHWGGFSPDQRFVLVPDLGLDQVVIYQVDTSNASLTAHGVGVSAPGAGPRHMKFHPNGKWIYVLNELDLTASLFNWNAGDGGMEHVQTIPTFSREELQRLPFASCSEIRIHPNGKFAYAANRGHDSISVFQLAEDGTMTLLQVEHVRGATPRNFNLDPSGKWLLVAGQDSHTLASFQVDPDNGRLTYNRSIISTPSPICVLMQSE